MMPEFPRKTKDVRHSAGFFRGGHFFPPQNDRKIYRVARRIGVLFNREVAVAKHLRRLLMCSAAVFAAIQSLGFPREKAAARARSDEAIATKSLAPPASETAFRRRLIEHPETALRELGVDPALFDLENAQARPSEQGVIDSAQAPVQIARDFLLGHGYVYGPPPGMRNKQSWPRRHIKESAPSNGGSGPPKPPPAPAPVYGPPPGGPKP